MNAIDDREGSKKIKTSEIYIQRNKIRRNFQVLNWYQELQVRMLISSQRTWQERNV